MTPRSYWRALSGGRTGEGGPEDPADAGRFHLGFARCRPVRGTGERANGRANPPRAQVMLSTFKLEEQANKGVFWSGFGLFWCVLHRFW